MLTVFTYKTTINHLIFHLERYEIVEVNIGENFGEILQRKKLPKVILFQIDLTDHRSFFSDTDDPHGLARKLGIRVLNYGLYNISKNWLQQSLSNLNLPTTNVMRSEISGDDKVIIKSDFNYGAKIERLLHPEQLGQLGIKCDFAQIPRFNEYSVCDLKDVSEQVWTNKGLIVEKFISNDRDTYIRIFKYFNRYVLVKLRVPGKEVKKMSDTRERTRLFYEKEEIPTLINEEFKQTASVSDKFFTSMGIDFGAIDVMTDNNGTNYIVDFNDTPFWGRPFWGEGNETKLIAWLSKNKISISYTARKTFNNMRQLAGL